MALDGPLHSNFLYRDFASCVAEHVGLFALLIALVLKFAKVMMIGAAVLGAGVMKFVRRKPRQESDGAA